MIRKVNVKLILELRDKGLSRTEIANSRHISRRSVNEVCKIAQSLGIAYRDVIAKSEDEVYKLIYPHKYGYLNEDFYAKPDYREIHAELRRVGVTLKLLWQEYTAKARTEDKVPVKYSKFCDDYSKYVEEHEFTSHIVRKPGVSCEVDWAGKTLSLYNRGKEHKVYLFVGVLSYSRYTYIEPCLDMKMNTWLKCNVNMLNFFKGAPLQIICDNLKTGVTKHPREGDIILNTEYERLGNHYHAAIMPARVKKPKDKPNAENAAGDCCTFIIARLRNRTFSNFNELCIAVTIKNAEYNDRPFSKADGSRLEMFRQEQEFLQSLPAFAFDVSQWRYKVKVAPNSHIAYKKNFYSCPHSYIGHEVSVCESFNDNMVRIYDNDILLASHPRFPETSVNRYSTHAEDLPKQSHYVEFDKERIEKWAKSIGNNTAQVIKRIFSSCDFEQQGYNPCLSVLRLSSKYGKSELERACEIALGKVSTPRYKHINAVILEQQGKNSGAADGFTDKKPLQHEGYLRGAAYYANLKQRSGGKA